MNEQTSDIWKGITVTYLNGPTVIIEILGLRFMTDPTFDPSGTRYHIGNDLTVDKLYAPQTIDPASIDYVLLSHDQHHDNFDGTGRELSRHVSNVFSTPEGATRLGGNAIGIATWEHHLVDTLGGKQICITSTPARHGPAGIEKTSGPVTGFMLSVPGEPELEMYITGDTVYYQGIAEVARRFKPNYIFVFAGGAQPRGPFNVTMSTNDAIDTSADFPDAKIIPLHFEGWSHYTQSAQVLSKAFRALGIEDRLLILDSGLRTILPIDGK